MPEPDPAIDLSVDDAPDPADVAYIEDQLNALNCRVTGYDDYRPLAIFVRNPYGAIIAGLTGFTWGGTLKIDHLWVHEAHRDQGYGARLVRAAEREALARGCRQAVLETHSFQAPTFYPKLGYVECGLAPDWPVGHQQHYFSKHLA